MTHLERQLHDAILRTHFKSFLRRCFMTLNPGSPYLPNWHIAAIAYQLERVRRGKITRLIINLPPRHLKSLTVSVAFPAFLLGLEPWHRISPSAIAMSSLRSMPVISVRLSNRPGINEPSRCESLEAWKTRF